VGDEVVLVVGVVPGLVGELMGFGHPLALDAGGGVHLVGGLLPHSELGVDVAGHVLGVADAGGGFWIALAGIEHGAGIGAIPEVDAEMVGGGVEGIFGDDLSEQGVYGGALSVGAVG